VDVKRLIRLEYLSILELNGEGSFQLLQGQITADMDKISEINSEIGAICDIKGRVVSSFCVIPKVQDEGYYLIGDKEVMNTTSTILGKYQPFYDVKLNCRDDFKFYAIEENELLENFPETDLKKSLQNYQSFLRIHYLDKNYHLLAIEGEDIFNQGSTDNIQLWNLDEINNKNFEISMDTTGQFTPHELGYHLSSRVDFEKGCYTGQEIVARMHYRAKKIPQLMVKSSKKHLPTSSKIINSNNINIGLILSSVENDGLYHYLLSMNKNFKDEEFEI